jgi:hypothetical protein
MAAKAATFVKEVVQLYQLAIGGSAIGSRRELAPAQGQKENAAPPPNKLDEQWVRTPPKGSGTGTVNEEELRTEILQYLDAGVNSNCDVGMRESSPRVEVIVAALEENSERAMISYNCCCVAIARRPRRKKMMTRAWQSTTEE